LNNILLDVKDLHTCYKTRLKENVYAVDGVSLTLVEGEILGIAGESGCGKSTLALSLMGFYFPPLHFISGKITLSDTDIMTLPYEELRREYLGSRIAYIPQSAMNALNPTRKVIHFIGDILREHRPDMTKQEIREMTEKRFNTLNLPKRALDAYPNELSGGMKQRIIIATSTILNPEILIADEPSSALDVSTQKVVIKMLLDMLQKKFVKSIIFITHELPLLKHISDHIIVMYAGRIMEQGPTEDVISNPVHPYSRALMGAIIVAEKEMKGFKLSSLSGAPPNLKNRIDGCPFAERCTVCESKCSSGMVPFQIWQNQKFSCYSGYDVLERKYKNG
jgi:peptide/nickel transport system ATP-binding protein